MVTILGATAAVGVELNDQYSRLVVLVVNSKKSGDQESGTLGKVWT